jgi:transposase-like protein
MYMKRQVRLWSKEQKEKAVLDCQRLGVVIGCQKHGIFKSQFYQWLERYNASGIEGLEDRRGKNLDGLVRRLEKENQALKEILAEKELAMRMKDELLKKKVAQWDSAGKSSKGS